jgi:hypothetical protein
MARGGHNSRSGNVIYGTNGDDNLYGTNGSFDLIGGEGDDTYIIDDGGDKVIEKKNAGRDHVISYVDFVLGNHVENLTLAGEEDLSGTGNGLDNIITGNSGANTLYGLGGDDSLAGGGGGDLIDGGAGSDTAVFAGLSSDYLIERDSTNLRVTYKSTGEIDILRNIEFLSFSDIVIAETEIGDGPSDPTALQTLADEASTDEDNAVVIAVLANDSGDGLAIASVANGGFGQVAVNANGTVTYTPNANANGPDSFSYTVIDALGQTSTASVMVNVSSVNDAPDAVADSYSALSGQVFASVGSVLDNDSDVDGDALTVSAYDVVSQAGGSVQMNADGTFTYTSADGFTGPDSFSYTSDDGNGGSATAIATITVTDNSAAPYYVDGLIYGEPYRFNYPDDAGTGTVVTYSFLDALPDYYGSGHAFEQSFVTFSEQQKQAARDLLALVESFTNLTFVETSDGDAGLTFGMADLQGFDGLAYRPFATGVGSTYSDIWIDAGFAGTAILPETSAHSTLLHEIGHAIGLGHPNLPVEEESQQYTVMDAQAHPTALAWVTGFQLYDIAALQYLYGANSSYLADNDVYSFTDFEGAIKTIWDAGGHDLFDMSEATYAVDINLGEGAFSTIIATGSNNIAIAFGTVIEDAIGSSYNDRLVGNDAANRLSGGGGDDELTGRGGLDVFAFTANWGNDTITDYVQGEDRLDFSEAGLMFADLDINSSASNTVISHGGNSVMLQGVETIDENEFVLA